MSATFQAPPRPNMTARQLRMMKYPNLTLLAAAVDCAEATLSRLERGMGKHPFSRDPGLKDRIEKVMGQAYVEALVCGPWAE